MGDPPGHLSPCSHALGLDQLGEIIKDGHDTDGALLLIFQSRQMDQERKRFPFHANRHLSLDGVLL